MRGVMAGERGEEEGRPDGVGKGPVELCPTSRRSRQQRAVTRKRRDRGGLQQRNEEAIWARSESSWSRAKSGCCTGGRHGRRHSHGFRHLGIRFVAHRACSGTNRTPVQIAWQPPAVAESRPRARALCCKQPAPGRGGCACAAQRWLALPVQGTKVEE